MRALRILFNFYVNSSIHVALGVLALTVITAVHFGLPLDFELLCLVFFGSVTGYNFVKYAGVAKLHHRSLAKSLKIIQVFSLLCFIAFVYYALQAKFEVLSVAAFFGIFTLLYALPVFGKSRNLRSIAGLKVFVIALVWAGVSVLFPVVNAGIPFGLNIGIEFFQRFLFVLVLILPFEIRDLKYDLAELGTIPQRIGIRKTKIMGWVLLVIWVLMESLKTTATIASFISISFTALVTAFLILKSREEQSSYFSSFWIEGIPLLWLGILLFAERIL